MKYLVTLIAVFSLFLINPLGANQQVEVKKSKTLDCQTLLGQGSVVIINDVVFLDSGSSSNNLTQAQIFNNSGSMVLQQSGFGSDSGQMDVSSLHSGIYEVEVETASGYTFDDIIFVF